MCEGTAPKSAEDRQTLAEVAQTYLVVMQRMEMCATASRNVRGTDGMKNFAHMLAGDREKSHTLSEMFFLGPK